MIWTPAFDMTTVPERILRSEVGRRNAHRRHSYTGGVMWKEHNPETNRCRCAGCIEERNKQRAQRAAAGPRPIGRPVGWRKNPGQEAPPRAKRAKKPKSAAPVEDIAAVSK
jgi:hypothetical protein